MYRDTHTHTHAESGLLACLIAFFSSAMSLCEFAVVLYIYIYSVYVYMYVCELKNISSLRDLGHV